MEQEESTVLYLSMLIYTSLPHYLRGCVDRFSASGMHRIRVHIASQPTRFGRASTDGKFEAWLSKVVVYIHHGRTRISSLREPKFLTTSSSVKRAGAPPNFQWLSQLHIYQYRLPNTSSPQTPTLCYQSSRPNTPTVSKYKPARPSNPPMVARWRKALLKSTVESAKSASLSICIPSLSRPRCIRRMQSRMTTSRRRW